MLYKYVYGSKKNILQREEFLLKTKKKNTISNKVFLNKEYFLKGK